jgi:FKBP-type peptidyl-prolyl cis-trans isomerase
MKQNQTILIGGALFLLIVLTAIATSITPKEKPIGANDFAQLNISTTTAGTGDRQVTAGDKVKVHYTGTLKDGTKFDSSLDSGTPFEVTVGTGSVIPGFDEGLQGMKLKEKRRLEIPSSLAYGSESRTGIPANSGLVFEIELVEFVAN